MLTRPIAFSIALLLGACATTDVSWVDPGVSQEPVAVTTLAAGIMDLAMSQGATPATAVHLIPLPEDHAADAITPALTAAMARQHFAFSDDGTPLRYQITPLLSGVLLRVSYGTSVGSLLYGNDGAGHLVRNGPAIVRGAP